MSGQARKTPTQPLVRLQGCELILAGRQVVLSSEEWRLRLSAEERLALAGHLRTPDGADRTELSGRLELVSAPYRPTRAVHGEMAFTLLPAFRTADRARQLACALELCARGYDDPPPGRGFSASVWPDRDEITIGEGASPGCRLSLHAADPVRFCLALELIDGVRYSVWLQRNEVVSLREKLDRLTATALSGKQAGEAVIHASSCRSHLFGVVSASPADNSACIVLTKAPSSSRRAEQRLRIRLDRLTGLIDWLRGWE